MIKRMYTYLESIGELYFIEVYEGNTWIPVGDVTLSDKNMPIAIGEPKYWGRGIGKDVISKLLERAKKIIDAAEYKAKEINVPMVIAVVDDGGNLIAQHRMDGSLLASISLAFDKAYTAVALKMSTDQAAKVALPGETLYGINTASTGRFIVFGGGFPLTEFGEIVGGLGVSGGSVEEDMQVARAGLAVW
jgi:uncharacterized protein GlcG (DUF336 family)